MMTLSLIDGPPGDARLGLTCVTLLLSSALFFAGVYAARVLTDPYGQPPQIRRRPDEDD